MIEPIQYLPTVRWTTIIHDVVLVSVETTLLPATYRVTVIPEDVNEDGAITAEKEVGFLIKDYIGHVFKITAINVDGDFTKVIVSDDFRTGYGPQTGRTAVVYKSVGMGRSSYIAPIEHARLDKSALDYSRSLELDILYKRLYTETFVGDITKWLSNVFDNTTEFGVAIGQDNNIIGNRSTTIGQGLTTNSFFETVIGTYSTNATSQNLISWVVTDRLFTIGNGQNVTTKSIALELFKSGYLKLYNGLLLGEYSYGTITPVNGTLQYKIDQLQIALNNSWYNFINYTPTSLITNTLLKWDGSKAVSIADGSSGYFLQTNGSGSYSWAQNSDTNYYPNSVSFGSGTLSLSGPGVNLSTSLDGRYSLLGHTHSYDYYEYWTLTANGANTSYVYSGDNVNFVAGTGVSLSKSSNAITINTTLGYSSVLFSVLVNNASGVGIMGGDYLNFIAGSNTTITKSGFDITISSTGGGTNYWTKSGSNVYPNSTSDRLLIGKTTLSNVNYYIDSSGTINTDSALYGGVIYSRSGVLIESQYECRKLSSDANINSGYGGYYCKTDGKPYFKNDGGTVYDLSNTGSSMTYPTSGYVGTTSTGTSWANTIVTSTLMLNNKNNNCGSFTITAGDFILPSDIRLKTNVKSIDASSKNIRFVEYSMKSSPENKRYGVIAQELEEIAPELVKTNEDGMKSVSYIDLLILKIAELEGRIKKLENG